MPLTIWIDADACPGAVKEIVFKRSLREKIPTFLVANRYVKPPKSKFVQPVVVDQGQDAADDYIVEHAVPGDLVITADIPLAALLVENKVDTISPSGTCFNKDNIGEIKSLRDFNSDLRSAGMIQGGGRPYSSNDSNRFASGFDRLVTRLMKDRSPIPKL